MILILQFDFSSIKNSMHKYILCKLLYKLICFTFYTYKQMHNMFIVHIKWCSYIIAQCRMLTFIWYTSVYLMIIVDCFYQYTINVVFQFKCSMQQHFLSVCQCASKTCTHNCMHCMCVYITCLLRHMSHANKLCL